MKRQDLNIAKVWEFAMSRQIRTFEGGIPESQSGALIAHYMERCRAAEGISRREEYVRIDQLERLTGLVIQCRREAVPI